MNERETLAACLRLSQISGLGLKTFHHLFESIGSIEAITKTSYRALLNNGVKPAMARNVMREVEKSSFLHLPVKIEDWLAEDNREIVCFGGASYPERLKEIYLPPPLLYLEGNSNLVHQPCLAIVGSRKPSLQGLDITQEITSALASRGLTIVSGLALGIDAAAHAAALSVAGASIAVMGTGIDKVYPAGHRGLHQKLSENGLVMTEMPLGAPPKPANFPRRNRVVSGLSLGVLVIEAGLKSGSLITARYALEQNRDVFAIPGGIRGDTAQGCNQLIQQGACLTQCADDVLAHYSDSMLQISAGNDSHQGRASNVISSTDECFLLRAIGSATISFDEMYARLNLDFDELSEKLLDLELRGAIALVAGGYQRVK